MQIVVDSLITQYVRSGTGKTVLVLHGWGDSSRGWLGFQKELEPGFDVVLVYLPGFGGSQTPPVAWGLDEYINFVAAFLQKINLSKLHAIIAHSNGGSIAIKGLAEGKLHADRLVLLNSAGIRNQQAGRKKAIRLATKAGKFLTRPLPAGTRQKLRGKLYESVGSDMLVVEHMQETFKRVVEEDVQVFASQLKLPTLLVYGEDDHDAPIEYGRIFHKLISGSQFETIDDAGHFSHLDKPTEVIRYIRKFLGLR